MPYDEAWLQSVLQAGQVRLVDGAPPAMPALSEKAFMGAVVRLARQQGWYPYHTTDSRRSPSGYPDLTLVHPTRQVALWAELKVPGGVLTLQQAHWLKALGEVERTEAHLWMPEDMEEIRRRLT
jgi:hypothetical protein